MGLQPTLEWLYSFRWELCGKHHRSVDWVDADTWCKRALTNFCNEESERNLHLPEAMIYGGHCDRVCWCLWKFLLHRHHLLHKNEHERKLHLDQHYREARIALLFYFRIPDIIVWKKNWSSKNGYSHRVSALSQLDFSYQGSFWPLGWTPKILLPS